MDKTAYKYYLLSRALEYQSRAAHALELNYNSPTFDNKWASEELKHFLKYQKEITSLEKELGLIDTSIPFRS